MHVVVRVCIRVFVCVCVCVCVCEGVLKEQAHTRTAERYAHTDSGCQGAGLKASVRAHFTRYSDTSRGAVSTRPPLKHNGVLTRHMGACLLPWRHLIDRTARSLTVRHSNDAPAHTHTHTPSLQHHVSGEIHPAEILSTFRSNTVGID